MRLVERIIIIILVLLVGYFLFNKSVLNQKPLKQNILYTNQRISENKIEAIYMQKDWNRKLTTDSFFSLKNKYELCNYTLYNAKGLDSGEFNCFHNTPIKKYDENNFLVYEYESGCYLKHTLYKINQYPKEHLAIIYKYHTIQNDSFYINGLTKVFFNERDLVESTFSYAINFTIEKNEIKNIEYHKTIQSNACAKTSYYYDIQNRICKKIENYPNLINNNFEVQTTFHYKNNKLKYEIINEYEKQTKTIKIYDSNEILSKIIKVYNSENKLDTVKYICWAYPR